MPILPADQIAEESKAAMGAALQELLYSAIFDEFTRMGRHHLLEAAMHRYATEAVKAKNSMNSDLSSALTNLKHAGRRAEDAETYRKGTTESFVNAYTTAINEQLGVGLTSGRGAA
jgi:hypothetical protein